MQVSPLSVALVRPSSHVLAWLGVVSPVAAVFTADRTQY
jgi:hypothetical protein